MVNIWKHGKYVDLWSLVHFLAGFLLGGLFYFLGTTFLWALAYSLILMLIWEIFEAATRIIEPSLNVVFDVLMGLAGFFLAALIYFYYQINFSLPLNLTVLAFALILALWGFLDFLKRGYR